MRLVALLCWLQLAAAMDVACPTCNERGKARQTCLACDGRGNSPCRRCSPMAFDGAALERDETLSDEERAEILEQVRKIGELKGKLEGRMQWTQARGHVLCVARCSG